MADRRLVLAPVRGSRSTRGRRPEPRASGRSSTVCSLVEAFGWERSVLARRQLDALEAAFVTEPKSGRLRDRLVRSWA